MKRAVIVLGMHRSGTSAMARALNLFGIKLPETLMEPVREENELGFWESRPLSELNEEILNSLGGSWDSPLPCAPTDDQVLRFANRLDQLLGEEFPRDDDQILIKDPRISWLVPLWSAALKQRGYRARYVIMLRCPIEVAMSLNKRNGLSVEEGLALWLQYTLSAVKETRAQNRLIVSYDQLLTDWRTVIEKIKHHLSLAPGPDPDASDQIHSFLQPDLKRHHASDYPTSGPAILGRLNALYFELLNSRSRAGETGMLDQLSREMESAGNLLLKVTGDYRKKSLELQSENDSLESENADLLEVNARLSDETAKLSEKPAQTYEENVQLLETIADLAHNEIELNAFKRSIAGRFALQALNFMRYVSRVGIIRYFICKRLGKKSSKNISLESQAIIDSGMFDEAYYGSMNPELSWMILDPLIHYVLDGSAQLKSPSVLFDEGFYRSQIEEGITSSGLFHYLSSGHMGSYNPHPLFDNSFYRQQLKDADKNKVPLLHYLEGNNAYIYSPHPNVDIEAYIDSHPGLIEIGKNPLVCLVKDSGMAKIAERAVVPGLGACMARSRLTRPLALEASELSFDDEQNPEISIVIPVFNEPELTIRCLKSLQNVARRRYEVIVVDDCSTDNCITLISGINGIRYTRNLANQGYLKSCNSGARLARGGYIVLLNNDTIVMDNWLDGLISVLETEPSVGIVGSKLIYPDGRLQEAGGIVYSDGSAWNYGRGDYPEACQYCYRRDVDYVSAASLAIRADLWRKLDGYDERYSPAYYEDTDLAYRCRAMGYRVVYCPASRVVHVEGASCGTDISRGMKSYQETNRQKFFERWVGQLARHTRMADRDKDVRARRGKKQLLWIDTLTPTPEHDSGSADTVNFFHAALKYGWGVTFVPWGNFHHAGRSTQRLQNMGVECIYLPHYDRRHCLQRLADQFDVIVVSRAENDCHLIPTLRRLAPRVKIVFNTVDLHFLRLQRQLAIAGDAATGLNAERINQVRKNELENINNSDLSIVISDAEEAELRKHSKNANTVVIPIQRGIAGCRTGFDQRSDILFIGGFRHPPNVDAVKHFVMRIWPIVQSRLPGVKFLVGGSNLPDSVRSLESDSVSVLGYIEDLDKVFESVRATVAPLRYGAGIKGKIVTSLGYGVPLVATSIAVEGMPLIDRKHALIADEPVEFAERLRQIYHDRSLWEILSKNGLQLAQEVYSIDVVSKKINSMLESLTSCSRPRA